MDFSTKIPENETTILTLWKKENLLQKLIDSRSSGKNWKFLDGPPFVNGNPHHGHLLVSTIKDVSTLKHAPVVTLLSTLTKTSVPDSSAYKPSVFGVKGSTSFMAAF